MKIFHGLVLLWAVGAAGVSGAPGLELKSAKDTVLIIKYSGTDTTGLTKPIVSIQGKAAGLKSVSQNVSGSYAIAGQVHSYNLPSGYKAGVIGAGTYGVVGSGTIGLQGEGASFGVVGNGPNIGVQATATATNGYAFHVTCPP